MAAIVAAALSRTDRLVPLRSAPNIYTCHATPKKDGAANSILDSSYNGLHKDFPKTGKLSKR
jgi:hypothetical protein